MPDNKHTMLRRSLDWAAIISLLAAVGQNMSGWGTPWLGFGLMLLAMEIAIFRAVEATVIVRNVPGMFRFLVWVLVSCALLGVLIPKIDGYVLGKQERDIPVVVQHVPPPIFESSDHSKARIPAIRPAPKPQEATIGIKAANYWKADDERKIKVEVTFMNYGNAQAAGTANGDCLFDGMPIRMDKTVPSRFELAAGQEHVVHAEVILEPILYEQFLQGTAVFSTTLNLRYRRSAKDSEVELTYQGQINPRHKFNVGRLELLKEETH